MHSNLLSRGRRPIAAALLLALCAGAAAQLRAPSGSPSSPAPGTPRPSPGAAPAGTPPAASAPAAPADTQAMEDAGRAAAQGWLALLDRRDWGSAWETAAASFRSTVPLEAWMKGIPDSRAETGPLAERTVLRTVYANQMEGEPPGDYVSVVFDSRFEKRQLHEIVTTTRERDGRWRVLGYAVQ